MSAEEIQNIKERIRGYGFTPYIDPVYDAGNNRNLWRAMAIRNTAYLRVVGQERASMLEAFQSLLSALAEQSAQEMA